MKNLEQQIIQENESMAIPQVLSFFRLSKPQEIAVLTHGKANHNYMVKTDDGTEYAVKFPIEETRESLENDLVIQEQLAAAKIGTSVYCHTADGKFIFDQGIMAVVSPKIEGVHPEMIDERISFTIGKVLAQFHQAVTTLPNPRHGWIKLANCFKT